MKNKAFSIEKRNKLVYYGVDLRPQNGRGS